MKKVLVVTYFFYPYGGQTSHWRTQTLTKLAKLGWNINVLRVKKDKWLEKLMDNEMEMPKEITITEVPYHQLDLKNKLINLLKKIKPSKKNNAEAAKPAIPSQRPEAASTNSTAMRELKNFLLFPDGRPFWVIISAIYGVLVGIKWRPDVVYVISNWKSNVVSGWLISKLLHKPLVVEYKDPWMVDTNWTIDTPPIFRRVCTKFEEKIQRDATVLIGPTEGLVQKYKEFFPAIDNDKWHLITHGFDYEELEPYQRDLRVWEPPLRMAYAATRLRCVSYEIFNLLKAIRKVNEQKVIVRLDCFGDDNGAREMAQSLGMRIGEEIVFHGLHLKTTVLDAYQASDVMVVLLDDNYWNRVKCTSKIFDLLGSRRPVLACTPKEGLLAKIIRQNKVGLVVANEDEFEIEAAIRQFFQDASQNLLKIKYDLDAKTSYERDFLVKRLDNCLNEAIGVKH